MSKNNLNGFIKRNRELKIKMVDKKKIVFATGKRKTAVAKAVLKPGKGLFTVNNIAVENIQPEVVKVKIMEPLLLGGYDKKDIDIKINAKGGGYIGQAEACRMALARGLIQWNKSGHLKKKLIEYDRSMIAGDHRRSEPKKFGGPGSRKRRQKSYR